MSSSWSSWTSFNNYFIKNYGTTIRLQIHGSADNIDFDDLQNYFEHDNEMYFDLHQKSINNDGTITLQYSISCSIEEFGSICAHESPISWIEFISEEYEYARFAFIFEDLNRYPWKYGKKAYENGESVENMKETIDDILKRVNTEFRNLIRNEFKKLLFPNTKLFAEDLKAEILSFAPYFGLSMNILIMLEDSWKIIMRQKSAARPVAGNYGWLEPKNKKVTNFGYKLIEKLKIKFDEILESNEHIISLRLLLPEFFENYYVKLIEDITAFQMDKRIKCKYYGSASGCRNDDKCRFAHNNPYSVELCRYYGSIGGCDRDNSCYFRHSESDQEQSDRDCYYHVISEYEIKEDMNKKIPPLKYFCFKCKMMGDHWIMDCHEP
eukprot:308876_1